MKTNKVYKKSTHSRDVRSGAADGVTVLREGEGWPSLEVIGAGPQARKIHYSKDHGRVTTTAAQWIRYVTSRCETSSITAQLFAQLATLVTDKVVWAVAKV